MGRVTPGFVGADLKVLAREAGMLAVSRIVGLNPDSSTTESTKHINQLIKNDVSEDLAVTECVIVKSSPTPGNSRNESEIETCGEAASKEICSPNGDSATDSDVVLMDVLQSDTTSSSSFMHLLDSVSAEGPGEGYVVEGEINNESVLPNISSDYIAVGMEDFLSAAKHVQPTAKREGFAVVPDVSWGKSITCSDFSNLTRSNSKLAIRFTNVDLFMQLNYELIYIA